MTRQVWPAIALLMTVSSVSEAVEKGSQRVSPFHGSFSYSVPIEVPGFRGLEPQLALSYSSEGRNGPAGVGWSLSGFSEVERVNAGGGTPQYQPSDAYTLDGQMLVPCQPGSASPSCTSGGTHSTRVESFLKIRFEAGANTWTVWGKDGTRTIYSPTYDVPGYGTLRWGKASAIDTRNNTVTYGWDCSVGACLPYTVTYNSYAITIFHEPRPDVSQTTGVLTLLQNTHRIRSVFVYLPGTGHIRAYKLSYAVSPASGRSLLTSVQQYGKDVTHDGLGLITGGTSLPPTAFTYQNDALSRTFVSQSVDPPAPGTVEPVVWTNRIRVYAWEAGNSLYKESSNGPWDGGAVSTRAIASGDGYVEFVRHEGSTLVGLSNGDTDQTNHDIDFAILDQGGSQVRVSENGVLYGSFPAANGDLFRVEVQGGVVRYKRNGAVFHTSTRTPTYPLLVDTSIAHVGHVIHNVMISGTLQQTSHWCPLPDQLWTGDFNGDGFTDQLCYQWGSRFQVALGHATGFQAPATWMSGVAPGQIMVGDFDTTGTSDGKTDLAFFDGWAGTFAVARSTGTSFAPATAWGTAGGVYNGYPYGCRVEPTHTGTGDFNGDGLQDVSCKVVGQPQIFIGLNNGSSGFAFSIFAEVGCDVYERTGAIDFNGDGKDDWYCIGMTGHQNFYAFISTGSSFVWPSFGSLNGSFCNEGGYVFGDFNGDGRTDASCRENGKVALSTGRVFVDSGTYGAWCLHGTAFASDVDGDGSSEMICNNPGAGADDIQVRKWQHNGLGPVEVWKAGWCSGDALGGDFNGDGKSDLLCRTQAAPVATGGTSGLQSDLASSVTVPLGGIIQATYAPATGGPGAQPTNNPPAKQVVASVTTLDGRGGSSTTTYRYFGGYMNRAERRFMGYRVVDEVKPCLPEETFCPYLRTYRRQDLAAVGAPEYTQYYTQPVGPDRQEHHEFQTASSHGVLTSYPTGEWRLTHDLTGCTTWPCPAKRTYVTRQFDTYGNVVQTMEHGDYDLSGDETTSAFTFRPNASPYIVDRMARSQQFAGLGVGGPLLAERLLSYDGSGTWDTPPAVGNLTRVSGWLNRENRHVSTEMTHDAWGNVVLETDETGRWVQTTFDASRHLFPTSKLNGAGESASSTWDPICEVPLQSTDPNGQPAVHQTDPLCRPSRSDLPLGNFEARDYVGLGAPATQFIRTRRPSANPADGGGDHWETEHLDGLGRVYERRAKGPTTSQTIIGTASYNQRGSVAAATAPHSMGEPGETTEYQYDGQDRPISVRGAGGGMVTYSYGPWSVTHTDEHGHKVTTVFDSRGRERRVEKYGLGMPVTVESAYDLLGRRTSVTDALGNQWTWSFDSLGRSYARVDPDAGAWAYEHDDAGRLLAQVDAKGQRTDLSYDGAGRVATKSTPDGTMTFNRSEPRPGYYNVGRLTSVAGAGTSKTIDYDAAGHPVRETRLLGGVTYQLERRYDSGGRLRGTTFPDGDSIGSPAAPLQYDSAGRLVAVPGIATFSHDARGRIVTQSNMNGSATTRAYGLGHGRVDRIHTTGGCSSGECAEAIQDLRYVRDESGQVETVSSPFPSESWSYTYDGLHRLTDAGNTTDASLDQTWTYDVIDRVTTDSWVGAYTYPPPLAPRPRAPMSVGGATYTYDANGNLAADGIRTLEWTSENRLRAADGTAYTYDAMGDRLTATTATEAHIYPFGDDYEIRNGVVTKYVGVPSLGVIAKRTQGQTYWLHIDQAGSIQAVSDSSGAVVQRRTYRPFGAKIADATGHVESRGYIDQRADANGFMYLHARYYNPRTGLFLSPDPLGGGFLYGLGDPVGSTDRDGLMPTPPTPPRPTFPSQSLPQCPGRPECAYMYPYGSPGMPHPHENWRNPWNWSWLEAQINYWNAYGERMRALYGPQGPGTPPAASIVGDGGLTSGTAPAPIFGRTPTPRIVPVAPARANLHENMRKAGQPGNMLNLLWFARQVGPGRPWDYKQDGKAIKQQTGVNPYEDFGNFNFGATGAMAGIPDYILLRGAGFAQSMITGTSRPDWGHWGYSAPYGDDRRDQTQIRNGIAYARAMMGSN
jgi:RHS repeat-associated protein